MADGLRRLDGVAEVTVDLQRNVCTVTPAPDRAPALEGVPAAVFDAGYRPGALWLRARGSVVDHAGARGFRIDGFAKELKLIGEPAGTTITARVDFAEGALVVEPPPTFAR